VSAGPQGGGATPRQPRAIWFLLVGLLAAAVGAAAALGVSALVDDEGDDSATRTEATGTTTTPATLPSGWAGVAASASTGVVTILATVTVETPPTPGSPFPGEEETTAIGSGFVLDKEGHIATNQHVVADASALTVTFADGTNAKAKVTGSDASTDLAVVEVDVAPERLHPLTLGSAERLAVGNPVLALGSPFGYSGSASAGIVSGLEREIESPNGFTLTDAIQTDAALNHGNSGGPLLDTAGRVVGISAQIADSGVDANVGVAFAVPIDATNKRHLRELTDEGATSHAWLGISGSTVDAALAEAADLKADQGALVEGLVSGSPADDAGLRPGSDIATVGGAEHCVGGDIIVAVDGSAITRMHDLQDALEERGPEDDVTLTVVRANGSQVKLEVDLEEQPESPPEISEGC
jgi:S1-C subfamily serine protease